MGKTICINQIFYDQEEDEQYRILWISSKAEFVYWIGLKSSSRIPKKVETSILTSYLEGGRLIEHEESFSYPKELTSQEKEQRDRIWKMMEKALLDEPGIYDRRGRRGHLERIEKETGIKKQNLYAYLARYWKGGKTPNAFIPEYKKRGARGRQRVGTEKRLGRPSHAESAFGKVLDENDFHNFEKAIKKYYLTRKELSFEATYEKMLSDSYSVAVKDNGDAEHWHLLPPGKVPSIRQFRYWYQKNRDLRTEIQKRKGDAKYELSSRSVLGKSDYGQMGPGSKYQIDATVGDIYLVSQFDRSNIIGRPVMYFVIDVFSRMVTGMYIGLEGPSWVGAMMAIANAASDKVAYCREYGISIAEEEWPCYHIPAVILGDRGEMESKNADNLVSMLGIRIENAPPYRADLKGIIEQHFRTINSNATVFLPGRVKPDMAERGGKDYRLDAKLDIRQFTAVIIKCVLYYNNSHYMESFEKSSRMMEARVESVPLKLWNWGCRYCPGSLRVFPEEKVKLALMPTENASVTGKGVRFKGLYYSSQEMVDGLWFEKARSKGSYRLKVSYDPRDMGKIYVWDQESEIPLPCYLLDWEKKYTGKQLGEVQYEQEKEKREKKRHQAQETEAKINLGREIDSIIKDAEKLSSTQENRPKSERLAGIRGNRKEEREQFRKQEAFTAEVESTAEQPGREETEEISPAMQMIRRKMEEKIKDESLYGKGSLS